MLYTNFDDILKSVENTGVRKKVALVGAEDIHALHAVLNVYEKGLIQPVLIGDEREIKKGINKLEAEFTQDIKIYDVKGKEEAAQLGVKFIKSNEADFLMKGSLETSQLLKAVVDKEKGLYTGAVMSHVAVNQIPSYHKLLVTTDGGMLPYPTLNQKKHIIENAVNMLHRLGYENPMVGVLAATEKINEKMVETTDAAALKEMNQSGEIDGCCIEGPISLDLALVKERARTKKYESLCAGEADILVVPNIHAGNILGKSLVEMAGAKMAGLVLGAECPIILTSRGSSYEEKFNSLMLACLVSGKEQ
ncbi:MAG: bifunctional enoyl-CoA hydratase/phosphate acetyltransferase [Anaerovoracaceae bacterium]